MCTDRGDATRTKGGEDNYLLISLPLSSFRILVINFRKSSLRAQRFTRLFLSFEGNRSGGNLATIRAKIKIFSMVSTYEDKNLCRIIIKEWKGNLI